MISWRKKIPKEIKTKRNLEWNQSIKNLQIRRKYQRAKQQTKGGSLDQWKILEWIQKRDEQGYQSDEKQGERTARRESWAITIGDKGLISTVA